MQQAQVALKTRSFTVSSILPSSPTLSATEGVDLAGKIKLTVGDIFEKPTADKNKEDNIDVWIKKLSEAANKPENAGKKEYQTDPNLYGYAGSLGTDGLRAAAAVKFTEDSGLEVTAKNIGVGTGAKGALNAIGSKFQPNDEIIMASPGWPTNFDMFNHGVKITEVDTQGRGLINPGQLEQLLQDSKHANAKGILINTPSNPTGAIYDKDEREELMKVIAEHVKNHPDFLVILDNPYGKIVYDGGEVERSETEKKLFDKGNIAEVRSMSKEYGLAGLRVGYVVSKNKEVIEQVGKWNENRGGLTAITQNMAQAALMFGDKYIERNVEDLRVKRKAMMEGLKGLEKFAVMEEPKGAIYGWIDFSGLKKAILKDTAKEMGTVDSVKNFLVNEAKIVGISGKPFYAPDKDKSKALDAASDDCHFRLCFSDSAERIREAMANLKTAINNKIAGAKELTKKSTPKEETPLR